ncbi:hypothetical protein ACHAWF_007923, partial [Thalassiosira exigua]
APPSLNIRNFAGLKDCLRNDPTSDEPRWDGNVTLADYTDNGEGVESLNPSRQNLVAPKLSFIDDQQPGYTTAKYSSWGSARNPASIFFAESEEEVMIAVTCARRSGYQVAPRGRGHSYQGLSNMDGYLTLDLSLMCRNNEFIPGDVPGVPEGWLLGDQRVLGRFKVGAGCTNAVVLAETATDDRLKNNNGGVYMIGSCPSVGIIGYATGGGQGDTSPYVGLGIDDVSAYNIVIWNETLGEPIEVTATSDNYKDLFFFLKGGGSGVGVVTSVENVIVQSPEPTLQEERKFLSFSISYELDEDNVRKFLKNFQDFLVPDLPFDKYKEAIRNGSSRYGGQARFDLREDAPGGRSVNFNGIHLGSEAELNVTLKEYGLLDGIREGGFVVNAEEDDYGRIMAINACVIATGTNQWDLWFRPTYYLENFFSPLAFDICKDLGINDEETCTPRNLTTPGIQANLPRDCADDKYIDHFVKAAKKPQSFVNRPGLELLAEVYEFIAETSANPDERAAAASAAEDVRSTQVGGIVVPRVDPDVLYELAEIGVVANHLAHGAPTLVKPDETGYANRAEYMLLEFSDQNVYDRVADLLVRKVYNGDRTKLRGFYNYMNAPGKFCRVNNAQQRVPSLLTETNAGQAIQTGRNITLARMLKNSRRSRRNTILPTC